MPWALFEPTCAYARWAHMHHFPSVSLPVYLSVTWPKLVDHKSLDQNSYLKKLGSWNLVRACMWIPPRSTLKVKVMGQRSRSSGQKVFGSFLCCLTGNVLTFKVKGHMGGGQTSQGLRSKVTRIKVSLRIVVLAGGVPSTSSCIF